MFAVLAINAPHITDLFHYHIPPEMSALQIGALVRVVFGRDVVQGVVVRFDERAPVAKTRPILEVIDAAPVMNAEQIALAEAMSAETLYPLGALIPLFLPRGLSRQTDRLYTWQGRRLPAGLSAAQNRLADLLQTKGPLRGRQLDRRMPRDIWQAAMRGLVKKGLVEAASVLLPPSIRPKRVRTAQLAIAPQQAAALLAEPHRLGRGEAPIARRQAALTFLLNEPQPVKVSWVYAASGCTLSDLRFMAARDWIILRETEIWRDPLQRMEVTSEPEPHLVLTAAQQTALDAILPSLRAAAQEPRPFLLDGVTASGKTEIYLRAVAQTLSLGRSALVLVPEIALTPQMVRRFMRRFPGQVGLLHSSLSDGERYDTWRRARAGLLKVIIGPRSALFAPLPHIGLIVLDECHDASYHQAEPPIYDAVSAAEIYARILGAGLILGSATPKVTQRDRAERGLWQRLRLPERVSRQNLPPVQVVDMRAELKSGNRGIFSRALHGALAETLARDEQAILYLNRRGTATYVFCRDCGHVLTCPHCDTPLTYHVAPDEGLRCHYCGYMRRMPSTCPQCGSRHIRQYGLGTERVEQEVGRLFPAARILRWDRDAAHGRDAHDLILQHFSAHRADVLIGTQMLSKGLDIPAVTLVGVVLAEVGLNLPDPFANERSFQLLTQVAGRAGRSARGGRVIFQTYQPEHYVIRAAAQHDVEGFYALERAYRQRMGYPPFSRLLRLEYRSRDAQEAERRAAALGETLKHRLQAEQRHDLSLIGPVPCFFARQRDFYRWQIILRGPNPSAFLRGRLPRGWRVDVDPVSLL